MMIYDEISMQLLLAFNVDRKGNGNISIDADVSQDFFDSYISSHIAACYFSHARIINNCRRYPNFDEWKSALVAPNHSYLTF